VNWDERDKKNLGRPFHFNLDLYLQSVEEMVKADEVIVALEMLDKVPSYYRVNHTEKIHKLRKEIYQKTMTIFDYAKESDEIEIKDRMSELINFPRGPMVLHFVKSLNAKGITPNLYDFGSASFWIPLALKNDQCKFHYKAFTINNKAHDKAKEMGLISETMGDGPNVFMCMEVIEHLFYPKDMVHWFYHDNIDYDYAIVSTPQHSLGGGLEDWRNREIGHIRTYTSNDLENFVVENIKELSWCHFDDHMQLMLGAKDWQNFPFLEPMRVCREISEEIDKQLGYYE
jgi:hypothetical protein